MYKRQWQDGGSTGWQYVVSGSALVGGSQLAQDRTAATGRGAGLYPGQLLTAPLSAFLRRRGVAARLEEYFLDKGLANTFIENHFDSSHNSFESVRRTADIWEWGNNVLWPGVFANGGPCADVGLVGGMPVKGCNDDVWPDGTFVRKGSLVSYDAYTMGRNEELWEAPLEFRPERFLKPDAGGAGGVAVVTPDDADGARPLGSNRRGTLLFSIPPADVDAEEDIDCLLYTSPSPRD